MLEGTLKSLHAEIQGSRYSFEALVPLYGSGAASCIAEAFAEQFAGYAKSVCITRHRDFVRFLKWIAAQAETTPGGPEEAFFSAVQRQDAKALTADVVYEAGEAWARRLRNVECFEISSSTNLLGRRPLLDSISVCLKRLSATGIWSNPGKFEPIARGVLIGGNIASLGELQRVEDIANFGSRDHRLGADYSNLRWAEVVRLNESRLNRLRAICVRDLEGAHKKWLIGQEIIADPSIVAHGSLSDLDAELSSLGMRRTTISASDKVARRKYGQALLIKYLALTEPHRRSFRDLRNTTLALAVTSAGGWLGALAHLEGTMRSLLAAQVIVMIDTGFNVSTSEALAAEPFMGSITRGKIRVVTISAAKLRARGELQDGTLLDGADIDVKRSDGALSGAAAIRAWQDLSSRIRSTARELRLPSADLLWIVPGYKSDRNRIGPLTPAGVDHHWRKFLVENANDPIIGNVPIRRQMIRPTVLQLEAARGGFEHTVARRLAQHSQSSTTMRYLSRPWFKAMLSQKMRAFLDSFEAILSEPAYLEAGKEPPDQYADRAAYARETGLGFLCSQPAGDSSEKGASAPCAEIVRCAGCSFRQFKPSPESLGALAIFERSIRSQKDKFIAANPARWAEVWLPYEALVQVLLEKLRKSRHRVALATAEANIDRALAEGTLAEVVLW